MIRFLYFILLIASASLSPWYGFFAIGLFGCLYFKNYIEFLLVSVLIDYYYGAGGIGERIYTIFSLLSIIISYVAKRAVRF
ncbi:MAG: hypothetical protein AAB682_00400 [Patescibacteria group bacterium]